MSRILFGIMLFVVAGCARRLTQASGVKVNEEKLLMIVLRADKKNNATIVGLERSYWTDGSIKAGNTSSATSAEWICLFLDRKDRILQEIEIDNPFIQEYEYYGTDGKLARKKIFTDSKSFIIRTKISTQLESILIKNENDHIIAKIKIPSR